MYIYEDIIFHGVNLGKGFLMAYEPSFYNPVILLLHLVHYTYRPNYCQANPVRCPGDTIHFMGFGYEDFIERLIELAGIQQPEDWKPYESWSPY